MTSRACARKRPFPQRRPAGRLWARLRAWTGGRLPHAALAALLLPAWLLLPAGPVAPAGPVGPGGTTDGDGRARSLQKQEDAAKVAVRRKDWAAATEAWITLLELDPRSLSGLAGLADAARGAGERDAEALARTELAEALRRAGSDADSRLARQAAENAERLAEIDPFAGRGPELTGAYAGAQLELARAYEQAGLPANAIVAWGRRMRLLSPGSAEVVEATAEITRLLRESPDWVVRRFDPGVAVAEHDEAWIAEQDKKSEKFSSALKWETPHYRIRTNAGWRIGSQAAAVMEKVHAYYREIWGIVPDPPPAKVPPTLRNLSITPIDVNIYATRAEYLKRSGAPEWSGGVFTGDQVATYDETEKGGKGSSGTMGTLFHEASHQFMSVAVGSVPSFVNEGIASLFEGIEILPNGSIRRDLPVGHYLVPLADKIRTGTAMPLEKVFNALENKPEQYEYRWGVMYFLRMYVDGQGNYPFRERLTDYVYEFKKGGMGDMVEHFQEFMLDWAKQPGLETFADFERTWRDWIVALDDERKTADKRLDDYRKKGRLAALKDDHEVALGFWDKVLDIAPDDPDALFGTAAAAAGLGEVDRPVAFWRRALDASDPDDKRRAEAVEGLARLDPLDKDFTAARRALVGGTAGLGLDYDKEGLPRLAMWSARKVLKVDPFDASSRALLARLERETGLSVVRWQRPFNGLDLTGWYGAEGGQNFLAQDGMLVADSKRTVKGASDPEAILYQALLMQRPLAGDWSAEIRVKTSADWQLVGIVFGARDTDHFEAILLRRSDKDEFNRVDFGTYESGSWSFPRLDGAVKASFDPVAGATLRVNVRGRDVSVSVDGQPLGLFKDKKEVPSVRYPLAALRGDVGVLASRGLTQFVDIRLLTDEDP